MHYRFGAYSFDPARYDLRHAGDPVTLRPQACELLAYLLWHRDRVVPKEELLGQVWPGQYVGDGVLHACILAVRTALYQLGVVYAHAGPPNAAQAEAHYQQALSLAEALGMRPLQAHCHHGLGMLYAATSQREQASAALSAAIALYRAMEMTFWLPQAKTALAQVGRL